MILLLAVISIGWLGVRYRQWRTTAKSPEIADTPMEPLGKLSIGALHFGAAFTARVGGSHDGYCDASSASVTPHHLVLSSGDCYALNLTATIGGHSYAVIIPMPEMASGSQSP